MSARTYVVALCGGGDRPIAALGERTAFGAAHTPNLDRMVAAGQLGLLTVISPGIPPESDSGAMALLGYDPLVHYTGRGPLEGLGMGAWDEHGSSVAFRVNFASRDERTGRLDRRTSRDLAEDDQQELAEAIRSQVRLDECPGVDFALTAYGRHRGIVCFTSRTTPLSGAVSNTDPGFRKEGPFGIPNDSYERYAQTCVPLDTSEGARQTAAVVNSFVAESARVLAASPINRRRRRAGHPQANFLIFRDGGHLLPKLPSFADTTGFSLALYGQVPAERGLCTLAGGRFVRSAKQPGQSERDYYAELVGQIIRDPADLVFVHLKGPDEPGHDGKPFDKVAAIEAIDREFVARLLAALDPADRLVITCDHATPCELGIHAADPVPIVLYGHGIEGNGRTGFSEAEAADARLPIGRAPELLPHLAGTVRAR